MSTILVVDDDPLLQRIYLASLATAGHAAAIAGSVAEAEHQLRAGMPDGVLLDLHLPDGDGIEVLRRIRDRPDGAGCRVAIFSGACDEDLVRRAHAIGADAILPKHGNGPAKVLAALERMLDGEAGPGTTARVPSPLPADPDQLIGDAADRLGETPSAAREPLRSIAGDLMRAAKALDGSLAAVVHGASAVLRQLADGAGGPSSREAVIQALKTARSLRADPTRVLRRIDSCRVLVVDDDTVARRLLAAAAAESGAAVASAADAAEALAEHRARAAQVLVTDLRMPTTSGLRLARDIAREPAPPRIIVATGAEGFEREMLTKQVHDVVPKPFLISELALRIQIQLLVRG